MTLWRVLAIHVVVAAGFLAPVLGAWGRETIAGGDARYVAWCLHWIAGLSWLGDGSVFDAPIFHPVRGALAFSDPNLTGGLLLAPLGLAGASPAALLNAHVFASSVLTGAATWALARAWGATAGAALGASLFFTISPIRTSRIGHPQLLAIWGLPLALWCFERALETGRRRWVAGLVLAFVAVLHSSIYLAAITLAALTVRGAWALGEPGRRVRALRVSAAAGVVAFALSLPLLSSYLPVRTVWGASRTVEENVRYAAAPGAYLDVSPLNPVWGGLLTATPDVVAPWEKALFPGLAVLVLAGVSLARDHKRRGVGLALAIAIVGGVMSLGPEWRPGGGDLSIPLPGALAASWLPVLRVPARWGLLVALGLAIPAGFAWARLRWGARAVVAAFALAEGWILPLPVQALPGAGEPPPWVAHLKAGDGAIVELPLARTDAGRRQVESARMLRAIAHGRPLANGYSGYAPPPARALAAAAEARSPEEVARVLVAWGIRTVVLHGDELHEASRFAWRALASQPDVRIAFDSPKTTILSLEGAIPAMAPVPHEVAQREPIRAGARVPIGIAPSPPVRALVPMPPEHHGWRNVSIRWRAESGESVDLWGKAWCPPIVAPLGDAVAWWVEAPETPGRWTIEAADACLTVRGAVEVAP